MQVDPILRLRLNLGLHYETERVTSSTIWTKSKRNMALKFDKGLGVIYK